MKRIFYILFFLFSITGSSFAQVDQNDDGGTIRQKMVEYIQQKLNLSKAEAEKFQPIFMDYLRQAKSTRQEFKNDKLILQEKMADLRLRTRDQLKPVLGEKRSNEVFQHEGEFIKAARQIMIDRRQNHQ